MVSYSDYARKLDGLDLFGLGLKLHWYRFPQIPRISTDLDLLGLGISQISGDFADDLQNFCFFLGGFVEKA